MYNIECVLPESMNELKETWLKLEQGDDMTAFQAYRWYESLNRQFLSGAFPGTDRVIYAVCKKDGRAVMIAPLHIKRFGLEFKGYGCAPGTYIFGEWGFTDYLNFIYNDFDSEAAEALIEFALKRKPGRQLFLRQIKKSSRLAELLGKNFSACFSGESCCLEIEKCADYASYKKGLSKSVRQNIRTANNRAEKEDVGLRVELVKNLSEKEAGEFFSIYLARSEQKNRVNFSGSVKQAIAAELNKSYNQKLKRRLERHNCIIDGLVNGGNNDIVCIYAKEKKIGLIYGLKERNGKIRIVLVCFDESFSRYSPGIIAIDKAICSLYENDEFSGMDLTRGKEKYKYDLGGRETQVVSYVVPGK